MIQKTKETETDKQLEITEASKLKEQAAISKDTIQIHLVVVSIDAETKHRLAEVIRKK